MNLTHAKTHVEKILMDQGILRDEEWTLDQKDDTGITHVRRLNFNQAYGVAASLKFSLIPNGDHTYRAKAEVLFHNERVMPPDYRSIAKAQAAIALYQEVTNLAALLEAAFEEHVVNL